MWLVTKLASLYRHIMDATKELFIRILMGILIFLGYVLLSLFIYAVMRRIMVPQKLHSIPVHLQYNSKCLSRVSDISDCPFPEAEFLLNDGMKLLRSGQYYRIALEMEVPEKEVNVEAGVFMVNLTFYSTNHRFLATSARPTTVRFKSSLLRTLSTVIFAIPLMFGLWEQKQTIVLSLFEQYYEPYGDGALSAKIFLETNRIHLYSTTLTIDANFTGFTYYLYQWPLSMTIIVVISILITLCTCTVLIWMRDVINDFEERRAMRLQSRRGLVQQQQRGGARAGHRPIVQQRGRGRGAETVGASSASERASDSQTGSQTGESMVSTEDSGAEREMVEAQSSGTVTPADTRESSEIPETESEISTGMNDIISNLRSLQREEESSSAGEGPGGGVPEGRAYETGELRRRTGNL